MRRTDPFPTLRRQISFFLSFFLLIDRDINGEWDFDDAYFERRNIKYDITCKRSNLESIVKNKVSSIKFQDSDVLVKVSQQRLDEIVITMLKVESLNRPVNIRELPLHRCTAIKYDFMPKVSDISFNIKWQCVVEGILDVISVDTDDTLVLISKYVDILPYCLHSLNIDEH